MGMTKSPRPVVEEALLMIPIGFDINAETLAAYRVECERVCETLGWTLEEFDAIEE
jgi:hypothetical protein